jgi:hypothetical protein
MEPLSSLFPLPRTRSTISKTIEYKPPMQFLQLRGVQDLEQLLPLERLETQPKATCHQPRRRYAAAAANAWRLICVSLCSVASLAAVQQVAVSSSWGTWSTAALSVSRHHVAATSLPNQGLAIFAGGAGTNFYMILSCFTVTCSMSAMCVRWGSVLCRTCLQISCFAQIQSNVILWISSARPQALGPLQLSA